MHRLGPTRRLLSIAAAAAIIACAALQASPIHRSQKTTRNTIEALENQWRVAQLNGDVASMDKLLSDDFVGITASGQVNTKAQQLARMRSRDLMLTSLEFSDIKIKIAGQIAIVTSRAEIVGTSKGAPLNGAFRYTRIYQRSPAGVWRITSFEATRIPKDNPTE